MKSKRIICCLATLALAFGVASVTTMNVNADISPTFGGVSVSLNENIVLKFGVENYSEDYALTFGYKGETYEGTVEDGVATFNLVTPQYLDEVVTATIFNGENKVAETKKSVKEYLYDLVNGKKSDFADISCEKFAKMKTLAVDMLNYGTAAQNKYLEENSFAAVNKDLTKEQADLATTFAAPDNSFKATLSGEKSDLYSWAGAGIRFDYNVSLYFLIRPTAENAIFKLKVGDNEVIDKYSVEDGVYKFRYEAVSVVDFGKAYTVKVLDETDKEVGQTLTYSVNTYILNMHSDESMGEIVKATYNYGVSALAYQNASDAHVYDTLEFAEEQRVIAGEETLSENLAVNKVCSACGHSEAVTEASYDTTKTFAAVDNTVEVTADGITYNAPVTVLTRIITPDENIIKFGSDWTVEFDRQDTFPEGYKAVESKKKGFLRNDFVEKIEYTIYNETGDLGSIYLIADGGTGYLTTANGKKAITLDGPIGDLYKQSATKDEDKFKHYYFDLEWSKLVALAIDDKYAAKTQYFVKAKVIAKAGSLYVDSNAADFGGAKTFTTVDEYLVSSGKYTAPDAKMMMVNTYSWDHGASAFEINRFDSGVDNRLSNANVAYIKYIIYDTYTGKELGAMKLTRVEKKEGYFVSMDNNQSVRLDYNSQKPALSDFCLVITKATENGGGLSDNGQKLKDLIDYAIKDNIPADGYYSIGFKGQVIVNEWSDYTDSEIYDLGKLSVLSDLISNYKPEA